MTTTQTVNIKGRAYTFTTEGAEERDALTTLGSLFNSRGEWTGYVVEEKRTGNRQVIGGLRNVGAIVVRKALADLTIG
jgi:hypothetical protein